MQDEQLVAFDSDGTQRDKIHPCGFQHPQGVDAVVIEESRIFLGYQRIDHVVWNLLVCHELSALDEHLAHPDSVPVVNRGRQAVIRVVQRFDGR